MTDPTQAKRASGGGRVYTWPKYPPYEFTVVSVTEAIKAGLAKPYLIGWASKMTAEAAVKDHDVVSMLIEKGDKKGAVNHLKGAQYKDMNNKGNVGNVVHDAIDHYLSGTELTEEEIEEALKENFVPDNLIPVAKNKVLGVMEFLHETEMEVIQNEKTTYNATNGYAGTPDIIGKLYMPYRKEVVTAVVDIKTSKRIYDDTSLQLCAYAKAEWASDNGIDKLEFPSDIESGVIVRPLGSPGKDGQRFERGDFHLSDELFQVFLGCLAVANGQQSGVIEDSRRA